MTKRASEQEQEPAKHSFPDELWLQIWSYLPLSSQLHPVCRAWSQHGRQKFYDYVMFNTHAPLWQRRIWNHKGATAIAALGTMPGTRDLSFLLKAIPSTYRRLECVGEPPKTPPQELVLAWSQIRCMHWREIEWNRVRLDFVLMRHLYLVVHVSEGQYSLLDQQLCRYILKDRRNVEPVDACLSLNEVAFSTLPLTSNRFNWTGICHVELPFPGKVSLRTIGDFGCVIAAEDGPRDSVIKTELTRLICSGWSAFFASDKPTSCVCDYLNKRYAQQKYRDELVGIACTELNKLRCGPVHIS